MKTIRLKVNHASNFIRNIWSIDVSSLPRRRIIYIRLLRIILLAIRGFKEDRCELRASALTFFSLLSIVPVLAMGFGISKGFGLEQVLEDQIRENFKGQQQVMDQLLVFSHSLLDTTKGGVIVGIGLIMLFYTIMKLLGNIEDSFNAIWQVTRARGLARKFTDYISVMLVAPILIILSSSVTVFLTTYIEGLANEIALLSYFSKFLISLLTLVPYFLIWLLLTITYMIMPNTLVNFKAAFIAGVIAGTIYQLVQWAYINFQIGVAQYNAIYGSFAALPLFLVWLQLSWLIILFGAEISFAIQNVGKYEFEFDASKVSYSFKKQVSLLIAHLLIKNFAKGEKAYSIGEVSKSLKLPVRLVGMILNELVECRIVAETRDFETQEITYQPAQDVSRLSIGFIVEALDKRGKDNIPLTQTPDLKKISESIESFKHSMESSDANKLLVNV